MSTISGQRESLRPGQAPGKASRLLLKVNQIAEAWTERRRKRRALLELSDHMLKDIGIGRGDAYREGSKPFWRG